jgi:hypothetical protein
MSNVRPPRKSGTGLGSVASLPQNTKRSQHLIDDISYSKDYIVCICAWKGTIAEFQPHRREMEPEKRR